MDAFLSLIGTGGLQDVTSCLTAATKLVSGIDRAANSIELLIDRMERNHLLPSAGTSPAEMKSWAINPWDTNGFALALRNWFTYDGGARPVAIIGPSGSGKSSLAHALVTNTLSTNLTLTSEIMPHGFVREGLLDFVGSPKQTGFHEGIQKLGAAKIIVLTLAGGCLYQKDDRIHANDIDNPEHRSYLQPEKRRAKDADDYIQIGRRLEVRWLEDVIAILRNHPVTISPEVLFVVVNKADLWNAEETRLHYSFDRLNQPAIVQEPALPPQPNTDFLDKINEFRRLLGLERRSFFYAETATSIDGFPPGKTSGFDAQQCMTTVSALRAALKYELVRLSNRAG